MSQPLLQYFAALGNCLLCWCCIANLAQQLLPALLSHYVQPLVITRTTASLLWTWICAGRTFWPASAGPDPAIMCTRGGGIHCQSCPIYALPSLHKICHPQSFAIQAGKKKGRWKKIKSQAIAWQGFCWLLTLCTGPQGMELPVTFLPVKAEPDTYSGSYQPVRVTRGARTSLQLVFFRSDSDHKKVSNWSRSSAATLLRFSVSSLGGLQSFPELFSISPHIFTAGALLAFMHTVRFPSSDKEQMFMQHRKRPWGEEGEPKTYWKHLCLLAFTTGYLPTPSRVRGAGSSSQGQCLGSPKVPLLHHHPGSHWHQLRERTDRFCCWQGPPRMIRDARFGQKMWQQGGALPSPDSSSHDLKASQTA